MEQGVVIGKEREKVAHPNVHGVLELLGKVLGVQAAVDLAGEGQRAEDGRERLAVSRVRVQHGHEGLEEVGEREGEGGEHVLDLAPQLVRLQLARISLHINMKRGEQ